jgi:hypothetical protein
MRRLLPLLLFSALVFGADELTPNDTVKPEQVVQNANNPLLIHVGFSVLYRAAHITRSEYAGPASTAEGIEALKKMVAGQPLGQEIVLYCGCCPFDKCPNVRPAFAALRELGYTNVKVIMLPENLKTDWIDKGYPTEKRAQ